MVGILGAKIIGLEFWRLEQVMFLINQTFFLEVSCLLLQESEDLVFQNTALGRVDPRPCTFVPEISLQYILYLLASFLLSAPHPS